MVYSPKYYISYVYEYLVFYYASILMLLYLILLVLSVYEILKYIKRNSYIDKDVLLNSPYAPGISVIAPAFNEGETIIDNVRSLLSLNYPLFEVVIVNDGSTDDTFEKLVKEYELEVIELPYEEKIETEPVRNIYKSKNPLYFRLTVVDKENGGAKADASNAGVNVAEHPVVLFTDVDCILHKDTLLKMVKPFIEEKEKVIATGAVIRLANSSKVDRGFLTQVKVPKRFLPRFQELEYIRSFLLGRMAWSRMNALMLVSGALSMFDKQTVLDVGGYDKKSFGEDMELLMRMCRCRIDKKKPYRVRYIPESLCWTEGPYNLSLFEKQRTRWAKGLSQTLWKHKKMMFNPKYGRLGMLAMPFWLLFEWLAPIIELTGIIYFIFLILFASINWSFAIILMVFVYTFSVMITVTSVLIDETVHKQYASKAEVFKLCATAFLEPFIYHPLTMLLTIRGNYFFFFGKKSGWGNMFRRGFQKSRKEGDESYTRDSKYANE